MAIRTYKVTLDSKNTIAPEPVYLRQGDKTGAVVINATLMDNGSPVSLSGLTPMFKANTADGQAVIADSTGFTVTDSVNGKFTYQVPNALSAVPGKITTAYFSLSDADGSESTFDVAFIIKAAVDMSQTQADDYITIVDGTLNSLQKKIDDMNTDIKTVLNAYNQGDFYNKSETDSRDASTLISAKSYANSGDSAALTSAKSYTDNSLSGIVALPETFANLAAIKAKYPNGANGVMVAADNGHKYIWANSTWTDAGVYQSMGIANGSVTNDLLAPSARYGTIMSSKPAQIDSVAKTLTLESVWIIMSGTVATYRSGTNPVTIALDPNNTGTSGFWIGFSPDSKEFSSYTNSSDIPTSAVYLGWINFSANGVTYDLHIPSVEVDGIKVDIAKGSVTNDLLAPSSRYGSIICGNPAEIDSVNKTLTLSKLLAIMSGTQIIYAKNNDVVIQLDPTGSGFWISFDPAARVFKSNESPNDISKDDVYLGWINISGSGVTYDLHIPSVEVDGGSSDPGLSFGFANKVGTTFGDSITQGVQLNGATNWTTMLGAKLHLSKITNAGISGTTYSKIAGSTISAVDRAASINGQDLIIVWFGINDYHGGHPLGTFGNGDVTTVFGATDYVYKTLITNNPTATIVVITPMKQHGYGTSPDSFTKNRAGLLQIDYVNAIKQVADYYSLPVLDLYEMSGMSPFVDVQKTQYFFDGLHPNAAGQYRLAQKIARFVEING